MEQTSLDGILNDKPEKPKEKAEAPAPVEKTETAPTEKVEAEKPEVERSTSRRAEHRKKELEAQGRDPETGKFIPKEEAKAEEKPAAKAEEKKEPAAPPKEELTPKERAAFAKAADETRKRQLLEQELNRLRQQQAPPPAAAPGAPKTFWDDPEGALKAEEQKRQQNAIQTTLKVSEIIARSKYKDFDEKVDKFAELAKTVPGLAAQWIASPDPAEFAYVTGKNHIELQQAGSIDNLRSEIEKKLSAEIEAKVEAKYKAKAEETEKQRAALTPSLSRVTGTGRPAAQTFTGPTSLDDILNTKH